VGVARHICQHRFGSAKRPLAVDDPFDRAQRRQIGCEGIASGQRRVSAEEVETAGLMRRRELLQDQPGGTGARARARAGRSPVGKRSSAPPDCCPGQGGERPPPGTMQWTCG
jgi:hypothetical protein